MKRWKKEEFQYRAWSAGFSGTDLKDATEDYLLISSLLMTHAVSGQKVSVCRHLAKRSRLAVCDITKIHEHNEAQDMRENHNLREVLILVF